MLYIADQFRQMLVPVLFVTAALLLLLLAVLVLSRAVHDVSVRRRARLVAKCRPFIATLLMPNPPADTVDQLRRLLKRREDVLADLLIGPARFATGSVIDQLRQAAVALRMIDRWVAELTHRRWWVRAAAARALGLVKETAAVDPLMAALDDDHEEVRAAVVEALGNIGDPRAVPALVGKLPDQSRHQRVRVIEALHGFGSDAVPALLAYERDHPLDRGVIAELLGVIADPAAVDDLAKWSDDERADVRAGVMQALGSIGLDHKTYYYALRALTSDPDADVRAKAARALGRGGNADAALYLSKHLTDDWIVAASAARALRMLGDKGVAALRAYVDAKGPSAELARQMLFEVAAEGARRRAVA